MRRGAVVGVFLLVLTGCGDDDAVTTTTSTTAAPTTTTTLATTTTADTGTTRTSFEAPPATAPNPERGPFVGIWRWANTHTRYMQLFDHGVIAVGDVVDSSLQLTSLGEWDVHEGVMTIEFLQIGPETCADDAVGVFAVRIAGTNLVMDLVGDGCEGRAGWLIGTDRTTRTWLPDDAVAP